MPLLTKNLFYGSGEGKHHLKVTEGAWPNDIDGAAYVIGPDKPEPGGHWLAHHGLIYKMDCQANQNGDIEVLAKRVNTPVNKLRHRFPKLFGKMSALEFSPFGLTNFANTNLLAIEGRMFVGYDIGRPIEVDANTLDYISAVGANDEWLQGVPAFLEPQISVAAHPAPDFETNELYFINYNLVPSGEGLHETSIASWDLDGKVKRWPIDNMKVFDTIHDIKSSRNFLVFTDLPFIVEPATVYGKPRKHANQDICQMWIIAKDDLRNTPPGKKVKATFVKIDSPAGHIKVDLSDDDDIITVYLQHIPATDLGLVVGPYEKMRSGEAFDKEYEGMISVGPQPNATGKYRINAKSGEILESKIAWEKASHWNSLLWTDNIYTPEAREQSKFLWISTLGYDPEMVFESAERLYKDSKSALVPFSDLPNEGIVPSIARMNLETMEYDDSYDFELGDFAHPPTFIPRANCQSEDDGYLMVFLNKDKPKEILLFDAANLSQGPVVRVSGDNFNPPLMLHTTWTNNQSRLSNYKVGIARDMMGAAVAMPKTTINFFKNAKNMNSRFKVAE